MLIDGIPSYDVVANVSPTYAIPRGYAGAVRTSPQQFGYVYGNNADDGTFFVDAPQRGSAAYAGYGTGANVSADGRSWSSSAAYQSQPGDRRGRIFAACTLAPPRTRADGADA